MILKRPAPLDPAQERARQLRAEQAAAEKAAREHAASPVGRAEAALSRGDGFFQIQLPVSGLAGSPSWFGSTNNSIEMATRPRTDGKPDVLTQIEAVGWHLEHVGYVFIATGATTSGRIAFGSEAVVTEGVVHGIYLFRARNLPGTSQG